MSLLLAAALLGAGALWTAQTFLGSSDQPRSGGAAVQPTPSPSTAKQAYDAFREQFEVVR